MRFSPFVSRCAMVGAVISLAGCGLFGHSNPDLPLIADSRSPIIDVPVPAGFSMAHDSTSKVVPNNIRFVDHRYTGNDDLFPVVTFYKAQLPDKGWTLLNQTQPSNKEVSMHFQNKTEDCMITITKRSLTFDTMIHIRIDPIGTKTGG